MVNYNDKKPTYVYAHQLNGFTFSNGIKHD